MSNNGGHVNSLPALFQMFDTPQHSMPSRGPHLIENQGQSLGSSHNSSSSDSFTPSRVNRDSQPLRPAAVTQQSSSSDMPEFPRLNIETQPLSQQNRVDQHNSHRMVTRSMTGSLKPRAFVSDYVFPSAFVSAVEPKSVKEALADSLTQKQANDSIAQLYTGLAVCITNEEDQEQRGNTSRRLKRNEVSLGS
ncbi:hypothetical protein LWI29_010668 [Acer saccharum]|uniref:Uncharacterized protein n=1 Tax=Acer saccharum TaxID=4024 RepID=A0AA39SYY7_ACESA|nr:hypothetical protein LWI29_010668 [Acer saccharum]